MISSERALTIFSAISRLRVLVVGDLFLDEYLIGRAERLSREGPVPVLAFDRRSIMPGGGANPARNTAGLGARTAQVGVIGDDVAGSELRQALEATGVTTSGIIVDPSRPTTQKTRIVAEGLAAPQQVARIDRRDPRTLAPDIQRSVVEAVVEGSAEADVVIVSHYRCGVVTDSVADAVRASRSKDALICVDAQGDLERFTSFDVVRIGRADAESALGRPLENEAAIAMAAREVQRSLGARLVMLGRGSLGTSIAEDVGYALIPPLNVSEVFDVSGAGDTMIAVSALAIAAGASTREAVDLAHAGAASVIRRLGVAAPSAAEIMFEIHAARANGS